jgi:hypothetical protein
MEQYQIELLTGAREMRQREVIEYQVNIDNYRLAIARISDTDTDMLEFRDHLQSLLDSSIREQKKAQLILDVVAHQLDSL